jgi:integrase
MEVEPIRKKEDVVRMYKWLGENCSPREAECFLIGCNIALRAGDLLSLRFDQVDGAEKVVIREQKSGFRKEIPITSIVQESVDRLKKYYSSKKWYKSKEFDPVYLFQSTSRRVYHLTQPVCIQWLSECFKKASKELNLGYNLNTHSMRKTWGYHAYQSGEDIAYVQALLNHREQYTTLRYIGVTRDYVEKMIHTHGFDIAK